MNDLDSEFHLLVEEITNNDCVELVSRVTEKIKKLKQYIELDREPKCRCRQMLSMKDNGDVKRFRFTAQETKFIRDAKADKIKSSEIVDMFVDAFPRWKCIPIEIPYYKIKRLPKIPQNNQE